MFKRSSSSVFFLISPPLDENKLVEFAPLMPEGLFVLLSLLLIFRTVWLVRGMVSMAEGLLGLLTEFAPRRIRTPRASRETLAMGSGPSCSVRS